MDAACLPLLARVALLERLLRWHELSEDEREQARRDEALMGALAGGGRG